MIRTYKVSAVLRDRTNGISGYIVHLVYGGSVSKGAVKTKRELIRLLDRPSAVAHTWIWNYTTAKWEDGEKIAILYRNAKAYLYSDSKDPATEDLGHLMNAKWLPIPML